jgi:taurine dioxygenase
MYQSDLDVERSAAAAIRLRKLTDTIGAEVFDIDLSLPMGGATLAAVRAAWFAHAVLLFRHQSLSEAQQIRFAEQFGPIAMTTSSGKPVMLVSNIVENGKPIGRLPDGEMWFHSDQSYLAEPCAGATLFAVELPSKGGNTLFADTYAAYESLSDATRARIAGLRAVHMYDYSRGSTRKPADAHIIPDGVPHATHPIVRTHPATGRQALYVNRLMTVAIEGLPMDESDALLEELFAHQEQPAFVYEHIWREGDLILWDNRCTLHARTDFAPGERRLLRRVAIAGDTPV